MTLNKMDQYLLQNLKRLADTGYKDEHPRAKYEDGTPAHSISITGGVYEVFDLSKGEVPISETRYIPWKSSINEILAIYQSQTNTQEGFESHGVGWWKDWCNEEGNIGRAYAYNLESHRPGEMNREVVKVKKIIKAENSYKIEDIGKINEIKQSIDGKIYKSKYRNYGEYIITNIYDENISGQTRKIVEVQFLNNGYITNIRKDSLDRGQHPKNNYVRTLLNIGYLGDFDKYNFKKEEIKNLKNIWTRMIQRCYDKTRKDYDDIFVDSEWHCFSNFLRDVRFLPQYHLAKENNFKMYQLDKDFYGSNVYSKESCVFLNIKDNTIYRKSQKKPILLNDKKIFLTYTELAQYLGTCKSNIKRWIDKKEIKFNNEIYKFEELEIEENFNYRYELSRNQVNYLLENLKNNPFSKRHLVSFYNWSNIDKKMLVECAYETLWTVRKSGEDLYLDMTLIHRSSDLLIAGTGINQIQYVALQMMVAKHCGYKVGLFEHYRKNVHVYDRHEEQVIETISRLDYLDKMRKESKIELKLNVPGGTCFYDIDINDFELIGYNPIKPQLKFPLAI